MAAVVQAKTGAQNTGLATVTVTWDTPATAGNLLVVIAGSDDYRTVGGIPTGFTESTGCKQETNLGHYLWWKVAAGGETSVSYTIGSASTSCWGSVEVSGLAASPYDISAGQFVASGSSSYTTPSVTATAGERLLVASIGGSTSAANFTGLSAWLNSFVEQVESFTTRASGTRDIVGLATRSVTADGVTGYSSGATYSPNATGRAAIIIAFKAAAGGSAVPGTAVASFTLAAGAAGVRTVPATAAAAFTFTAAATGTREVPGAAGSTFGFAATAAGVVSTGPATVNGTAAAALSFTAAASSVRQVSGLAAGTLTFTAAAAGVVSTGPSTVTGTAVAALSFAAAATGTRTVAGVAAGTLTFTAAAVATRTVTGTAATALTLTASAVGAGATPPPAGTKATSTATVAGRPAGSAVTARGVSIPTVVLLLASTAAVAAHRTSTPEVTHG